MVALIVFISMFFERNLTVGGGQIRSRSPDSLLTGENPPRRAVCWANPFPPQPAPIPSTFVPPHSRVCWSKVAGFIAHTLLSRSCSDAFAPWLPAFLNKEFRKSLGLLHGFAGDFRSFHSASSRLDPQRQGHLLADGAPGIHKPCGPEPDREAPRKIPKRSPGCVRPPRLGTNAKTGRPATPSRAHSRRGSPTPSEPEP